MAGTDLGGIIGGQNPIHFNSGNPLPLFLVQAAVIIIICRLLQYPLSYLRQPRVIAEVIGGILLGPTALGRIPSFSDNLFPKESLPFINLVANFGLVFFLFLVGLELDPAMLIKSARRTLGISLAGMALPFGAGVGVSYALYWQLDESYHTKGFGGFLLFCGIAMSITAFPVLARILSELSLLKTHVGSITISAAAVDDAVSWCLLALVIAIINAGAPINTVYILLVGIGYVLFLILVVRPLFVRYFLKRFYNPEIGPSQLVVTAVTLMVFVSAFFTDALGIHAIFGGFVIGVIMPHEGGFAVKLTEKIEDMITIIFLPLYFALSGLNTEIGLLNDGKAWGMVVLVIVVAIGGKVIGCTSVAKLSGMTWREAATVGFLMNCKGLVELIVLNLGLQAGVIDRKVFAILVLMALVTTFITTPIVMALYPPRYWRTVKGITRANSRAASPTGTISGAVNNELLVCLSRMRQVPAIMQLMRVLAPRRRKTTGGIPVVHALRLVELGQRESAVMRGQEVNEIIRHDPVSNVLRAFGQLSGITVDAAMTVSDMPGYPNAVADHAMDIDAGLVVVPWTIAATNDGGAAEEIIPKEEMLNTIEFLGRDPNQSAFIEGVFESVPCTCAVLIDHGLGNGSVTVKLDDKTRDSMMSTPPAPHTITSVAVGTADPTAHSTPDNGSVDTKAQRASQEKGDDDDNDELPSVFGQAGRAVTFFFGGDDDRRAVELASAMARNGVMATVVRYHSPGEVIPESADQILFGDLHHRVQVVDVTMGAAEARADAVARTKGLSRRDVTIIGRGDHTGAEPAAGLLGSTAAQLLSAGCRASMLVVRGPLPFDESAI